MALDLPEAQRERLAAWRDGLVAGRDDLRPVPAAALHVTLVFISSPAEEEIDAVARAALAGLAGLAAASLEPRGVVAVPKRRPRLFALDLLDADGAAGAAQASVSDALEQAGFYRPERRPFWPHVTLARVRGGRAAAPLEGAVASTEPLRASDVVLYRSWLRPSGAVYEPLARASLR